LHPSNPCLALPPRERTWPRSTSPYPRSSKLSILLYLRAPHYRPPLLVPSQIGMLEYRLIGMLSPYQGSRIDILQ
jgi:hypothetical protein